ncbi:MAG: SDR family oxidoreductase [Armatimonadota bacterium]
MAKSLSGTTALITGAAKRIGRAIALTLANEGVNIVVHYNRSDDEAEDLRRELADLGVKSWAVRADFAQPTEYVSLLDRALEAAGSLDILVNNASIFPPEKLDEMTLESLNLNIEVNAWVPFQLSRDFAQKVGKGSIVNLIDSRTRGYDWNHTGYILSKHVLGVMTRMLALKYAPDVTVNGIAPGLILPPPGQDQSYLDKLVHTVPLKRHGDTQDIADAALYLLKSNFLTGEVIYVDGGRHLLEYIGGQPPR